MVEHSFTLIEYDQAERWVVLRQERRTVELEDGVDFHRWATEQWPSNQYEVRLDPKLDPWPQAG